MDATEVDDQLPDGEAAENDEQLKDGPFHEKTSCKIQVTG
jgi:hypothetical protein